MSVVVKGMKMPERCGKCRFATAFECQVTKNFITTFNVRQIDCPLVPVPPHGRLIDESWLKEAMTTTLEALKKNPKMDRQEMHLIAAFDTLRVMLDDAPTIIPAEDGE